MRYDREVSVAVSLGFTEIQLRDFKWVFDALDADGSGRLDIEEVHSGMLMMDRPVARDRLERMMRRADADASGGLEFMEFLELMKILYTEEGWFREGEAQLVNVDVQRLDIHIIRRTLEFFRIPKTYASALPRDKLVEMFCRHMRVRRTANVSDALGVRSVPELYRLAGEKEVLTLKKL